MARCLKRGALTAIVLAVCMNSSYAGFVSGFSGNSGLSAGSAGGGGGWVNFAYYSNTGASGNWLTDLGLTADTGATFNGTEGSVLFMQMVTDSTGVGSDFTGISVAPASYPWTGIGTVSKSGLRAAFVDSAGIVGEGGGTGINPTVGAAAASGGQTLESLASTPFAALAPSPDFVTPTAVNQTAGSFQFAALGANTSSAMMVLTAGGGDPIFGTASTSSFPVLATNPSASVPVANPEPSSLALMSLAAVGYGVRRRRRKNSTPAAKTSGDQES